MKRYPSILTFSRNLPEGYTPEIQSRVGGPRSDLVRQDGRYRIEIKYHLFSIRDLSATLLYLSRAIHDSPQSEGCLLLVHPRITPERLKTEWQDNLRLLHPGIAARLHLLIVPKEGTPAGDLAQELRPVLDWISQSLKPVDSAQSEIAIPRESFFLVLTTLLNLWFRREGPKSTLDLQRKTGLSYPTVVRALDRLEARKELVRISDRRIGLARFPQASWQELVTLAAGIRGTRTWSAPEGERVDLERLLERVRKHLPSNGALGGVEAARHWDPDFDLNGIPRIDITLQVPDLRTPDLDFLRKIDPSLRGSAEGAPTRNVLAIHLLKRPESFFAADSKGGNRFADPVETLLDLQELRLGEQADALLRRIDPKRPT